ncbi:MAG TPA: GyrI-like domain-containing protein [Actinomycetota bacterium]|nr:GyrI-like domain-containing protein [Actinomycetota bacterium]
MYDVRIERTGECATAVVKANTTRQEFPTLWGTLLDEVWAFLRERPGLRTDGHNVMVYRNNVPGVDLAVEVGVQVTRIFEPSGRVVPSVLPAAEVAAAVHSGPTAEIGTAYDAIRDHCRAANRRLTGVSWEVYGDPHPGTGAFDVAIYSELG